MSYVWYRKATYIILHYNTQLSSLKFRPFIFELCVDNQFLAQFILKC